MPSRKAELPMNGAAKLVDASTLPCEPSLLLLAALLRRRLSASLGDSRRALTSCTTRDFVARVFPAARLCVCASSNTPTEAAEFDPPKHLK